MANSGKDLSQTDVLVVEDEAMISFLVEDMLRELGVREVWLAPTVAAGLDLLKAKRPHVAILDINLNGESAYAVAECLQASGIPFMFASGYGRSGVSKEWAGRPVVQKPFDLQGLSNALAECLV